MLRMLFNRWLLIICFLLGFYFGQQILFHICFSMDKSTNKNVFYEHFQYRTHSTCQSKRTDIFLTIAVLSSFDRLHIYLPAIIQTWLLTTTIDMEIIIFLEEKSSINEEFIEKIFSQLNSNIRSCFYLVRLKHVVNDYPPQKKSFYAMKYLYTFYSFRTAWILRLDDNAYVNIPLLIPWLKSLDYQQNFYIGQGGTGRHQGPAIHFPTGKYFCMGGSGVILSRQTLIQLGPWLDFCYENELRTVHEDVELGRCILIHAQISCTNAYDSKILFYHHYGPNYEFGYDFTPKILSQAFIVHPMKDINTFLQIYHYYQRKYFHLSKWKSSKEIPYVTFLNAVEFDLVKDIHYQKPDVRWKEYLQTTVQTYIEYLRKNGHQNSRNWTIVNGQYFFGYRRVIPTSGLELLVEILLNSRISSNSTVRTVMMRKRLNLRQYFLKYIHYREIQLNNDRLNLIVVANNRDQTLKRFIQNFQNEILKNDSHSNEFFLTILYFSHFNSSIDYFQNLSFKYSSSIRLIMFNETQYKYNRGLGRQLASNYFYSNELLFFLDVDISFTRQALINTRRLIVHQLNISTCAVYFPIIYSKLSRSNDGTFSIYGFGNVALRKSDLERIGGWQTNNYDWGDEDVNLFSKFVNQTANCQIFRMVEPGLVHIYHKKMCTKIENRSRKQMCLDADASLLGSSIDMINDIKEKKLL